MTGAVVWSASADVSLNWLGTADNEQAVLTVPSGLLSGYDAGSLIVALAAADTADPATPLVGDRTGASLMKFRDSLGTDWAANGGSDAHAYLGQDASFNPTAGAATWIRSFFMTERFGGTTLGFDTLNNGGTVECILFQNPLTGAPSSIPMVGSLSAVMYGYTQLSDISIPFGPALAFNDAPTPPQPTSDPGSVTTNVNLSLVGFGNNIIEFGFVVGNGLRGHTDTALTPNSIFTAAVTPSVTDAGAGVWVQYEAHAHGAAWTCIGLATEPPVGTAPVTEFSSLPFVNNAPWHNGDMSRKIPIIKVFPYAAIIG